MENCTTKSGWYDRGYCSSDFPKFLRDLWIRPQYEASAIAVEDEPYVTVLTPEGQFRQMAREWEEDTWHVSSIADVENHPRYRDIVALGWPIVPFLLRDLQQSQRFWLPALARITGLRPFDPNDAGDMKRMTAAWINWGKKKGLI